MNIKPLRDIDQHEILPFFSFSGSSANKGTFVSVVGSGLNFDENLTIDNLSYTPDALSASFGVPWKVQPSPSGSTKFSILGMTVKNVRTTDENGYPLIYEPRKAAEMDAIASGQAVPVAKRGFVLYSGIVGTPAFGSGAAVADAGDGSLKVVNPITAPTGTVIGKFLGPKDSEGYAPLSFDVS